MKRPSSWLVISLVVAILAFWLGPLRFFVFASGNDVPDSGAIALPICIAWIWIGDLGAEVIKIEPPDGGDPFRGWGAADYSATFGSVNRNKKSVILDLKSEGGIAAARALAANADVLIENFRVGTMDRLGLGYETLRAANPRLI